MSDAFRVTSTLLIHCLSALKGNHTPNTQSTLKMIKVSPTSTVLQGRLLVDNPSSTASWKLTYL